MENTPPPASSQVSFREQLDAIVVAASKPAADDGKRLCELVWKLAEAARKAPGSEAACATGRVTIILHRILKARTGMPAMARRILETLCGLGEFGRIIAGRHVRSGSISGGELSAMLHTLPVAVRLDIADELLIEGVDEMPRGAKETADMLMGSIAEDDAPEVAAWLARAGARHWTVSHPLSMSLGKYLKNVPLDTLHLAHAFLALGGHGMDATMQRSFEKALEKGEMHTEIIKAADRMLPSVHPFRSVMAKAGLKAGGSAGRTAMILYATSDLKSPGSTLARLHQSSPGSGSAISSVLLPPKELRAFYGSLKGRALLNALALSFDAAADAAPKELLNALAEESPQHAAEAADLKKVVSQRLASRKPKARPLPRCRTEKPDESGFFDKLFREGRHGKLAKIMTEHKGAAREFDPQVIEGLRVVKFERKGIAARNSTVLSSAFEHCSMDGWDLSETHFFGCTFEQCSLHRAVLEKCRFRKCTFKNCTFDDCDMGHLLLRECRFVGCTFTTCDMQMLQCYGTTFRKTRFRECTLPGAELTESRFSASRFRHVTVTDAILLSTELHATEFIRCALAQARMFGCTSLQTTFDCCGTNDLEVCATETTCHIQMAAWLAGLRKGLIERASEKFEDCVDAKHSNAAARALMKLARHIDFTRREMRMLRNDSHRMNAAMRRLQPDQRDLLLMLPHLLESDIFEKGRKDVESMPCRLPGYAPSMTVLGTLSAHFPTEEQQLPDRNVVISALYSMGSVGSLAQTTTSDLDCWLVVKSGTASRDQMLLLNRKCRALEKWAWDEYSLELHFFVMEEDAVRANHFGLSDAESSGSAQAILLKEEFYRTALKIAGHHPVWWLAEPGCTAGEYANTVRSALTHPMGGTPRMIDLGALPAIPPGEYFGAALWQMIKAIHSPFKSVMKLGLLDRYSSKTNELPLADLIKKRIQEGEQGSARVDPYAAMYLELKDMYAERKDQAATALLAEAFLLKAVLSSLPYFRNLPATREAQSLVEVLFGSGYVSPEVVTCDDAPWTFSQSLEAGASVSDFMTASYKRIRSILANTEDSAAQITPEDLTRLGRRILANFARKQDKVSRIPFLDVGSESFSMLRFSAAKKTAKPTIWHLQAMQRSGSKGPSRELQELLRHEQAAMLPAWLIGNCLYRPEIHIQADRSIAPLAATDLQRLLSEMAEFFPYEETFEPELDEGLKPETVVKAFLIVNLDVPPESKSIESLAVIFSTNWGEMFCKTFRTPDPSVAEDAGAFLESALEHKLAVDPELGIFMPRGAQCPRLTLI